MVGKVSKIRQLTYIATSTLAFLALSTSASAATFSDGFETGSFAAALDGFRWGVPNDIVSVTNSLAYSGGRALSFTYPGTSSGVDSMAQATLVMPAKSQYWFSYKLYVPSNYVHRTQSSGGSNNKFLAVYSAPYSSPGFQVNFSTQPSSTGGSDLEIHHYNAGREGSVRNAASDFITLSDRGKWLDILVQVAVPTSSTSSNGIMRLWKNGTKIVDVSNLPSWGGSTNHIDQAYFMGWSNSGFNSST